MVGGSERQWEMVGGSERQWEMVGGSEMVGGHVMNTLMSDDYYLFKVIIVIDTLQSLTSSQFYA